MENFVNLLKDIEGRELKITNGGKGEQIQQTQRNNLKQEILQALFEDLKKEYSFIYHGDGDRSSGILVEVSNQSIANNMVNEEGSGAITLSIDVKVLGLDTNAEVAEEIYQEKRASAEAEKAEREAKKAAKIAKDKAERERKKAENEKKRELLAEKRKEKKEEEGE